MRNHDSAACRVASDPASAPVSGPANSSPTATTANPISSASQDACTPSPTAASVRPAPYQRAAREVVPYSTNVPTIVSSPIRAAPTASPPSGRGPR